MALIISSALICGAMGSAETAGNTELSEAHSTAPLADHTTTGYDAGPPASSSAAPSGASPVNSGAGCSAAPTSAAGAGASSRQSTAFLAVQRSANVVGCGCFGGLVGFCIGGCLTMGGGSGPALWMIGTAATTVGATAGASVGYQQSQLMV